MVPGLASSTVVVDQLGLPVLRMGSVESIDNFAAKKRITQVKARLLTLFTSILVGRVHAPLPDHTPGIEFNG